jgi:hypothetical protein
MQPVTDHLLHHLTIIFISWEIYIQPNDMILVNDDDMRVVYRCAISQARSVVSYYFKMSLTGPAKHHGDRIADTTSPPKC